MPIVRIDLFPGRNAELKARIAREITHVLRDVAAVPPADTTVIFTEVARSDWMVAGEPFPEVPGNRGPDSN
jgi:4-oxalocrotonate tautomerase